MSNKVQGALIVAAALAVIGGVAWLLKGEAKPKTTKGAPIPPEARS